MSARHLAIALRAPALAGALALASGAAHAQDAASFYRGKTLTILVGRLNERYPNAPLGRAVRRGLTPVTIGLMFAGASILVRAVNHDWRGYAITLLTVVFVLRKPTNPLWLLGAGAAAGLLGLV